MASNIFTGDLFQGQFVLVTGAASLMDFCRTTGY